MLVFREGRRTVPGPALCDHFRASLDQLTSHHVLDILLRAGELECALADAQSPLTASVAAVTDALSAGLVGGSPGAPLTWTPDLQIPESLTISRPEGFAYYGLHPLDYAEAVERIPYANRDLAVLGIRSIGTTLSAVVTAAARRRTQGRAQRITVRPCGHPFDRVLHLTPRDRQWIENAHRAEAHFVVVDEGPGLSGSSFLAVAEALVRVGVPENRITLLGSTVPDLNALRAPDAATRWARFHLLTVTSGQRKPGEASLWLGGGKWRALFAGATPWHASWTCFERQKYLSQDGRHLFKFEGLSPYGDEVLQRGRALARAGFSPSVSRAEDGFLDYDWLEGARVHPQKVTASELERLAEYCAWRAAAFGCPSATPLETMLLTNLQEEFGEGVHSPSTMEYRRVAVVDGRMHPHEWRLARDRRLMKLDSTTHGDDHFFPGPADIAWDLAGAIVEWNLNRPAAEYMIARYALLTGDDPRPRLPAYLPAYAMFRLGYCRMAAESMRGSEEAARFRREAEHYRTFSLEHVSETVPHVCAANVGSSRHVAVRSDRA
jgi:hypothetical protein